MQSSILCCSWLVYCSCLFYSVFILKEKEKTLTWTKASASPVPFEYMGSTYCVWTAVSHRETLSWQSLSRQQCYSLPVSLAHPSHFGANGDGPAHWFPGAEQACLGQAPGSRLMQNWVNSGDIVMWYLWSWLQHPSCCRQVSMRALLCLVLALCCIARQGESEGLSLISPWGLRGWMTFSRWVTWIELGSPPPRCHASLWPHNT